MTDAYDVIAMPAKDLSNEVRNLILSRWLRSLRFGNDYFKLISPASYYANYDDFIQRLLAHAWVRLAVLADDRDVVLGFSVYRHTLEGGILDYVHVHKDQRRQGIARRLVPDATHTITHLTRTGLTLWGSKRPEWKFDPFA